MEFAKRRQLLNELVLVDGIGRSGKVMLAEIITGLNRVEKQEYHEFLEYIPLAYSYGKISKDIAISILQTQLDTELYKSMIGRSINTRLTDYTSLYKFHSPEKYLKRQLEMDGPIVYTRVLEEKPIYLNWCHDLIPKSNIIFEAFKDKVKLVYINRHPVDIIYEWNKKNFGERVSGDPTEMHYLINYKDSVVPELALGWEEEYLNSKPMERIIRMIYTSFKRNLEALLATEHMSHILVMNFEDIVTSPQETIKRLEHFLNTSSLDCMDSILYTENCPRVLKDEERYIRENMILNESSKEYIKYLDEMKDMYIKLSGVSNETE